jgi:hypothetical protein
MSLTATSWRVGAAPPGIAYRQAAADVKRRLRARELAGAELILSPPPEVAGYLVFEVLRWIPYIGPEWLRRMNPRAARAGVNFAVPLGDLTPRQREWLVERVGMRATGNLVPA